MKNQKNNNVIPDEADLLNNIEKSLYRDRGTIFASGLIDHLVDIIQRYNDGFYDQENPWQKKKMTLKEVNRLKKVYEKSYMKEDSVREKLFNLQEKINDNKDVIMDKYWELSVNALAKKYTRENELEAKKVILEKEVENCRIIRLNNEKAYKRAKKNYNRQNNVVKL